MLAKRSLQLSRCVAPNASGLTHWPARTPRGAQKTKTFLEALPYSAKCGCCLSTKRC